MIATESRDSQGGNATEQQTIKWRRGRGREGKRGGKGGRGGVEEAGGGGRKEGGLRGLGREEWEGDEEKERRGR